MPVAAQVPFPAGPRWSARGHRQHRPDARRPVRGGAAPRRGAAGGRAGTAPVRGPGDRRSPSAGGGPGRRCRPAGGLHGLLGGRGGAGDTAARAEAGPGRLRQRPLHRAPGGPARVRRGARGGRRHGRLPRRAPDLGPLPARHPLLPLAGRLPPRRLPAVRPLPRHGRSADRTGPPCPGADRHRRVGGHRQRPGDRPAGPGRRPPGRHGRPGRAPRPARPDPATGRLLACGRLLPDGPLPAVLRLVLPHHGVRAERLRPARPAPTVPPPRTGE